MTPTLAGRLQTRLALGLLIGVPLSLLTSILLGALGPGDALLDLAVITGLGLGWDLLHHTVQEPRRERDWPRLLTVLSWLPEAVASWWALGAIGAGVALGAHLTLFTILSAGLVLARAALLPVLLPRWRHQGQRLAGALPVDRPVDRSVDRPVDRSVARSVTDTLTVNPALTGLRDRHRRFATLTLLVGVVGSVVFLAPLFDREPAKPAAGDAAAASDARIRDTVGTGRSHHGAKGHAGDTHHRVRPTSLEFPAARVSTSLGRTRVNDAGVLVTPDPARAAWYGRGAAPGQRGAAVLIGSADGVFAGLDRAAPGQSLRVVRADGSQVWFTVDRVAEVDARSFPTRTVYGATGEPLLRLVGYDAASGRNTIVFARAVMMAQDPTGR